MDPVVYSHIFSYVSDIKTLHSLILCCKLFGEVVRWATQKVNVPISTKIRANFLMWCNTLKNLQYLHLGSVFSVTESLVVDLARIKSLTSIDIAWMPALTAVRFCHARQALYGDLKQLTLGLGPFTYRNSEIYWPFHNTTSVTNASGDVVDLRISEDYYHISSGLVHILQPDTIHLNKQFRPYFLGIIKGVPKIVYHLLNTLGPLRGIHNVDITIKSHGRDIWAHYGQNCAALRTAPPDVYPMITKLDMFLCPRDVEPIMIKMPHLSSIQVSVREEDTIEVFPILMRVLIKYPQLHMLILEQDEAVDDDWDVIYNNLIRPWHMFGSLRQRMTFSCPTENIISPQCCAERDPEGVQLVKDALDTVTSRRVPMQE